MVGQCYLRWGIVSYNSTVLKTKLFIYNFNFSYLNENGEVQFKRSNISHLVEHPLQMRPPSKYRNYIIQF